MYICKGDTVQTCLELILVDGARVISVVALEGGLPVIDVLPESPKLLKVDGSTAVTIKHTWRGRGHLNVT